MDRENLCPESVHLATIHRGETILVSQELKSLRSKRLSENEKFFARSRKAKILTAGIH